MSEKITITVAAGGDDADARAFGAVLRDVLDTLDAIAKQQVGGGIAVTWKIVGLNKQSPPSITLECRQNISVVNVFLNGLRDLQTMAIIPFPPPAMKSVRRLGRRMRSRQVDSIIVESPGLKSVAPTERIADNAEKAIAEKHYTVPSSVDGRLDVVNIHARARFSVFDDTRLREVRCHFPSQLLEDVRKSLGKRVTVSGDVRFDAFTDRPLSIAVESIDPIDDDPVKPKLFSEMEPIDITGGMASEEYIRRLRDGG